MRQILLISLVLGLLAIDATAQPLFTGNNLDGWVVDYPGADRVSAVNGALRATERAGWVRTERTSFGTFVLKFDARAVAPRVRAFVGLLGSSPTKSEAGTAYVVPLFAGERPDAKAFSKFRLMVLPLNAGGVAKALRSATDWQSYQITRSETTLSVILNGDVILSTYGPASIDGWIGFLTQGGPIELRNIQLDSAPPAATRTIYQPGNGITYPRVLHEVKPSYTSEAMHAKIQGTVLIECVVETDGSVSRTVVVRSLDQRFGLDQEAVRSAKQWRFIPGTRQGEPVPTMVTIELTFTLK